MSLRQSRLSFGPPKPALVASTANSDKNEAKVNKDAGSEPTSKPSEEKSKTPSNDVEMEEEETVRGGSKSKKRERRLVDSDDEDTAQEPTNAAEETKVHASTQEHREEELATTTKKLKLDAASPKKPKTQAIEKISQNPLTTPEVTDDLIEAAEKEEAELQAAQADDIEQAAEAVEIKQAAAKWADMFSRSSDNLEAASWKKGEPVPYAALCQTFELIEATPKRLQILDYLVKFLIQVIKLSPESLLTVIYLSINKLCPEYEGLELGIGESLLLKAIAESTGREMKKIKADYAEIGDLGIVAMNSRSNQPTMFKPKALTIPHVFKTLKDIASLSGNSSQKQKVDKIKVLLVSCRNKEAKFLMRSLEGKLRIGLAERTVVVALAQAIVLSRPDIKKISKDKLQHELEQAADVVKSVYSELPCYDLIVPALLKGDIKGLQEACKLTPGIPLKPMLAHPTKALTDILDRFENIAFTCEYKYDGERAQIHKLDDGSMRIYSRNSENMSAKYPDVMERLVKFAKANTRSFVLDCEAVAWDREQKCILPFQVLSTRKRKDVKEEDIKVQVCIFAFDLLYLNGESLLREPLSKRRELLLDHFNEVDGEFAFAKSMNSTQIEDIQIFLDQSVTDNCEGLMVKTLDGTEASYEPSKRSRNWLKVKKDYLAGVGDSIDLVVIGAYIGKGKRTGVYGGFLLACYDPDREEYQSICKIGTGFSEQDLEDHYKELKEHVIPAPRSYYILGEGNRPDVWFAPEKVWEIKCADLSISPVYKAAIGIVDATKGISLRFPRFIRLREDKSPESATSSEQIAEMYKDQKLNTVKSDMSKGVDMDFDY
ncbi:DNA ligase 1 [Entomortierella parvispora]|uniref:DNA ligase n=1 Tax=Entomortierella parvispora TaxID=205924 RepID=A0A9P3M2D3_9FUNG|nr:DNA ligase 1 [Entomortierella parvispora]